METNTLDLDDLHDDNNPEVIHDPLEKSDSFTPDINDPVINTPAATEPIAEPASTKLDENTDKDPASINLASGMELFLSQYDIEGGMITYEDGTTSHISELSSDEQAQILSSVANDARPKIEDQYDLDKTEIGLLNKLRTSDKSVEDYINDLAQERFNTYKADSDSQNINYEDMDRDAVYIKFLKEQNSSITESEIEEGLSLAKDSPTYDTLIKGLRDNFISEQDRKVADAKEVEVKNTHQELETDRQTIVEAVNNINDIGGFEIPREVKNDVLHDLLEVNEFGDSLFLENTFSDPKTMFKTAWFSKYGETYLSDIDKYYKQEITKAYKRGQAAVTEGLPSTPRSLNNGAPVDKSTPPANYFDSENQSSLDLDDLHNME